MKRHLAKSAWLLGALVAASPALAMAAEQAEDANPFKHIVERNVFALKPPPPPPDPNDVPPPPPPPLAKVTLTGILNVLGPPRALLEVVENEPGKPPAGGAQTKKPILREGEREGSIEVVSIDVEKNLVRIKNGGFETNLTFEAQKQTPAGAVAGVPLPQLQPVTAAPPPGAPDETGRRGVVVVGGTPVSSTPPTPTTVQLPTRQIRASQVQQSQTQNVPDPVAQWVQLKAQEERARQQNNAYPPSPPVPGMDDANTAQPQNPQSYNPRRRSLTLPPPPPAPQ